LLRLRRLIATQTKTTSARSKTIPTLLPYHPLLSEQFLSAVNPFLLQAEIAAAVLLGIGIIFEADRYCEEVKRVAFHFVMWGVVLETIFSIALFASEERISQLQHDTISAQQEKIIRVEMEAAARSFEPAEYAGLGFDMSRFRGTSFTVFVAKYDSEAGIFAGQLQFLLESVGWKSTGHIKQLELGNGYIMFAGAVVFSREPGPSGRAALELAADLQRLDFCAGPPSRGMPLPIPEGAVNIVVGNKRHVSGCR
jgi:hypothetical protein